MNIITGLKNFLLFVNNHWTEIMIIIGSAILLYRKVVDYMRRSDDEKIEIALTQIREIILGKCGQAEKEWEEWKKSGSVKRAQVIAEIYQEYPILNHVVDQEELIKKLDEFIDEALKTLREIVAEQGKESQTG